MPRKPREKITKTHTVTLADGRKVRVTVKGTPAQFASLQTPGKGK